MPTNKLVEASVDELIKGFLQSEVSNNNREPGVKGNQGASEDDVIAYLLKLGYREKDVKKLVGAAPVEKKPEEKEAPRSKHELTPEQENDFLQIQKFIKGGGLTRSQLSLLYKELRR